MSLMNEACWLPLVWLLIDELMHPFELAVASFVIVVVLSAAVLPISLFEWKLADACHSLALGDSGVNFDVLSTDDDRELAVVEPLL